MSRNKLIFANWKMNLDINSSNKLVKEILDRNLNYENIDVVIAPPFVYLSEINNMLINSRLKLSAQNVFYNDNGAFTGEISHEMLKDLGCSWVMIGHSERRIHLFETNEMVNKKIIFSCEKSFNIIFCVGESNEEKQKGKTFEIIKNQISESLKGVDDKFLHKIVVGYEPIWAIGSGIIPDLKDIQETHNVINHHLKEIYPNSDNLPRIVYGGSVDNSNIDSIMSLKNVDGVLVGSASLDCKKFCDIVLSVGKQND